MLPNAMTITRILIIPIYLMVYYSSSENGYWYAGILFIVAGITDVLDGYIARKYNMTSDLGALLDPLADKLIMFAVLIPFYNKGILPLWILIVLIVKEVIMLLGSGVLYLFKNKTVVPSNIFGKIATVLFYIASLTIIFRFPPKISKVLFIITIVLNLIALANYLILYIKSRNRLSLIDS